jgi:hypothetical protein
VGKTRVGFIGVSFFIKQVGILFVFITFLPSETVFLCLLWHRAVWATRKRNENLLN